MCWSNAVCDHPFTALLWVNKRSSRWQQVFSELLISAGVLVFHGSSPYHVWVKLNGQLAADIALQICWLSGGQ